jgi:hypothetical protein
MNKDELIKELADLGWESREMPVVSRGFEVTGATVHTDESGRKWIELESQPKDEPKQ